MPSVPHVPLGIAIQVGGHAQRRVVLDLHCSNAVRGIRFDRIRRSRTPSRTDRPSTARTTSPPSGEGRETLVDFGHVVRLVDLDVGRSSGAEQPDRARAIAVELDECSTHGGLRVGDIGSRSEAAGGFGKRERFLDVRASAKRLASMSAP